VPVLDPQFDDDGLLAFVVGAVFLVVVDAHVVGDALPDLVLLAVVLELRDLAGVVHRGREARVARGVHARPCSSTERSNPP
jgi:hypothetical protein